MTDTVYEIAICKLIPGSEASAGREKAMTAVRTYPGFVRWKAMDCVEDPLLIADLVEWESLAHASAAGENVMKDPAFADYMGAIAEVVLMRHFTAKSAV